MALKNHGPGGCCCAGGVFYLACDNPDNDPAIVEYAVDGEEFDWDTYALVNVGGSTEPLTFAAAANGTLYSISTLDVHNPAGYLRSHDASGSLNWQTSLSLTGSNRFAVNSGNECIVSDRSNLGTVVARRYDTSGTFDDDYDIDDFSAPESGATSGATRPIIRVAVDGDGHVFTVSYGGGWSKGTDEWPISEFENDGTPVRLYKRPTAWRDAENADGCTIYDTWGLPSGGIHVLVVREDSTGFASGRTVEVDIWRFSSSDLSGTLVLSSSGMTSTTKIISHSAPDTNGNYNVLLKKAAPNYIEIRRYNSSDVQQWATDYAVSNLWAGSLSDEWALEAFVEDPDEGLIYYLPQKAGGGWYIFGFQTSDGSQTFSKYWSSASDYTEAGSMIRATGVPLLGG